jgi:alpha-D-xyloside xylohydrolase
MKSRRTPTFILSTALAGLIVSLAAALPSLASVAGKVDKGAQGITLNSTTGVTHVEIWSDRIVRVTHLPVTPTPLPASLSIIARPTKVKWKFADKVDEVVLTTALVQVRVDKTTGQVRFLDEKGLPILSETSNGTSLTPVSVGSAKETLAVTQRFMLDSGEAIYGLGQHQNGVMNYVGSTVQLLQKNMEVSVPVLLSSKGYAVLWDNPAVADVDVGQTDKGTLAWKSEAGSGVDYYFIQGPEPDQAIGGYRWLTGAVPMMGKWGWGFWQCRERYKSQDELLGVVAQYRRRGIPLDGVIQDWQYWPPLDQQTAKDGWGSHEFDPARYPDPAAMVRSLHQQNVHLLISVWPKFDVTDSGASIPNLQALEAINGAFGPAIPYVYPKGQGKWYDPFNDKARGVYWKQISTHLASLGIDGWWLDASEAELSGKWGEFRDFTTAKGSGALVFNAYPLEHTRAVYEGQRAETSAKRVFILTRSAYAGQQRNAAVTWSGDINGTWEVFRKQIPAGLNFTASGIPYWNTDIGGFFVKDAADPKYVELFTRWFQFGAFNPMFRVHGTNKPKEVWRFDSATQEILTDYINLRYHLLPYIYSVSWMVTHNGYTMMRPLVMDFRADAQVQAIADQFMFGPALLVNPVTQPAAQSRSVYLPAGTKWADFWTGKTYEGGQTIEAAAGIQTVPLFVKAGSILPYGPAIQYASESADPMELRVYRGADGSFTLYEDEGDGYNYEKGAYATIPIRWDEKKQVLTIGARHGVFPSMLRDRTFRIVVVSEDRGTGIASTRTADAEVKYHGREITWQREAQQP